MAFKYTIKVLEEVTEGMEVDENQVEMLADEIKKKKGAKPQPKMKFNTKAGMDDLGAAVEFVQKVLVNRYDKDHDIYIFTKAEDGGELEVDHFPGAFIPAPALRGV